MLAIGLLSAPTISQELLQTELYTFHEAMPVQRGTKFAANVWLHQYDYHTPRVRRRCAMGSFAEGSVDPRWEACQKQERRPAGRCEAAA